ncbi:MAG TPA: ankyrin repeat domain-containing protein, partial [Pseudomonadota bacterium]|nr:ankyrin repeat domain-containing protein [Pseudomonadota bacterium]
MLLAVALLFAAAPVAAADSAYDTFVQAVATDRSDQVRAMLARGTDPNTVDPNGDPVLLVAARAGWQPTLDALLGAGAKVDARNPFGDRPIGVAALNGHLAIVKTLLAHGAELDAPGWTPLIYASTNGQIEVVRYLL